MRRRPVAVTCRLPLGLAAGAKTEKVAVGGGTRCKAAEMLLAALIRTVADAFAIWTLNGELSVMEGAASRADLVRPVFVHRSNVSVRRVIDVTAGGQVGGCDKMAAELLVRLHGRVF